MSHPSIAAGRFESTDEWTDVSFPEFEGGGETVAVSSITSFNGWNTAGVRLRNVSDGGMEAFVEEETSGDSETDHVPEGIRYLATGAGSIRDASDDVIGEAGVVEFRQPDAESWETVSLDRSYDDPVVVAQIASYDGSDPSHVRIRSVESGAFDVKIEEWDVENGPHVAEEISYVVLESGVHDLDDGPIDVQRVTATHDWSPVSFDADFGRDPAVVSRSQTFNGAHEIVTRHRNVDADGVEVRLQEEEGRGGAHTEETVGVIATPRTDIGIGYGHVEDVDHRWTAFDLQTRIATDPVFLANLDTFEGGNTATPQLRNLTRTGGEVRVEEEHSSDEEMRHDDERISLVSLPTGPIVTADRDRIGEAGRIETDQPDRATWHDVSFDGRYSDPVVFAEIETFNGSHPSHVRVRNVDAGGFQFQIEEWDYLDGEHTTEVVGWAALEAGVHELSDGGQIHVGTTQSDHQWNHVSLVPNYWGTQPAVLTQSQTFNGHNEIVTRTASVSGSGFDVRVQEEEGRDGTHYPETVGFVSIARPNRQVPDYQTTQVPDVAVEDFTPADCGFAFSNSDFSGSYTLPRSIGPIDEIGDTSNGMCGGMVFAAKDYFRVGASPWPDRLTNEPPENSPTHQNAPAEDTQLFDFLSERLFDSFAPSGGNVIGAGLYQTLMNSANTKKRGQVKKSRNEVMRDHWEDRIKPALDDGEPCPIGLIHVDTHGNPFKTGLNQIGDNHQVLAYGYSRSGDTIDIHVYDPNYPGSGAMRVQFTKKSSLKNWFEPRFVGSSKPLYAFFAIDAYAPKDPPRF